MMKTERLLFMNTIKKYLFLKGFLIFFLVVLLLLPVSGFAQDKTYTIVFHAPFAPFVERDGKGGLVGFEVDIFNAIAKKEGFRLNFITHPWKGLFDNLNSGKADIVASGITITEARKSSMDFSQPYYQSSQAVLLAKGMDEQKALADIKAGKVVVQEGSTSADLLTNIEENNNQIIYQDSVYLGVRNILTQKADAFISDSGPLKYYAKKYESYGCRLFLEPSAPKEYYGFAVKKDSPLKKIIDAGLMKLMADGTYATIYQKWFGSKPSEEIMQALAHNQQAQ